MDIFFVLGLGNTTKVPMLNIACHGTGHQVAIPVPSRQGQQIRRQYRAFWKRVYGTPRVIVIDGEKGFSTGVFPDAAGGDSTEGAFYRARQTFNTKNQELGRLLRAGRLSQRCDWRECARWFRALSESLWKALSIAREDIGGGLAEFGDGISSHERRRRACQEHRHAQSSHGSVHPGGMHREVATSSQ
eukprot:9157101-Pyramimonas_sp.AAC.1